MNDASNQLSWPVWLGIGLLLLSQGTALFLHARSRGGKAWLWGLWGLTHFPSPALAYMLLLWWKKRKNSLKEK